MFEYVSCTSPVEQDFFKHFTAATLCSSIDIREHLVVANFERLNSAVSYFFNCYFSGLQMVNVSQLIITYFGLGEDIAYLKMIHTL